MMIKPFVPKPHGFRSIINPMDNLLGAGFARKITSKYLHPGSWDYDQVALVFLDKSLAEMPVQEAPEITEISLRLLCIINNFQSFSPYSVYNQGLLRQVLQNYLKYEQTAGQQIMSLRQQMQPRQGQLQPRPGQRQPKPRGQRQKVKTLGLIPPLGDSFNPKDQAGQSKSRDGQFSWTDPGQKLRQMTSQQQPGQETAVSRLVLQRQQLLKLTQQLTPGQQQTLWQWLEKSQVLQETKEVYFAENYHLSPQQKLAYFLQNSTARELQSLAKGMKPDPAKRLTQASEEAGQAVTGQGQVAIPQIRENSILAGLALYIKDSQLLSKKQLLDLVEQSNPTSQTQFLQILQESAKGQTWQKWLGQSLEPKAQLRELLERCTPSQMQEMGLTLVKNQPVSLASLWGVYLSSSSRWQAEELSQLVSQSGESQVKSVFTILEKQGYFQEAQQLPLQMAFQERPGLTEGEKLTYCLLQGSPQQIERLSQTLKDSKFFASQNQVLQMTQRVATQLKEFAEKKEEHPKAELQQMVSRCSAGEAREMLRQFADSGGLGSEKLSFLRTHKILPAGEKLIDILGQSTPKEIKKLKYQLKKYFFSLEQQRPPLLQGLVAYQNQKNRRQQKEMLSILHQSREEAQRELLQIFQQQGSFPEAEAYLRANPELSPEKKLQYLLKESFSGKPQELEKQLPGWIALDSRKIWEKLLEKSSLSDPGQTRASQIPWGLRSWEQIQTRWQLVQEESPRSHYPGVTLVQFGLQKMAQYLEGIQILQQSQQALRAFKPDMRRVNQIQKAMKRFNDQVYPKDKALRVPWALHLVELLEAHPVALRNMTVEGQQAAAVVAAQSQTLVQIQTQTQMQAQDRPQIQAQAQAQAQAQDWTQIQAQAQVQAQDWTQIQAQAQAMHTEIWNYPAEIKLLENGRPRDPIGFDPPATDFTWIVQSLKNPRLSTKTWQIRQLWRLAPITDRQVQLRQPGQNSQINLPGQAKRIQAQVSSSKQQAIQGRKQLQMLRQRLGQMGRLAQPREQEPVYQSGLIQKEQWYQPDVMAAVLYIKEQVNRQGALDPHSWALGQPLAQATQATQVFGEEQVALKAQMPLKAQTPQIPQLANQLVRELVVSKLLPAGLFSQSSLQWALSYLTPQVSPLGAKISAANAKKRSGLSQNFTQGTAEGLWQNLTENLWQNFSQGITQNFIDQLPQSTLEVAAKLSNKTSEMSPIASTGQGSQRQIQYLKQLNLANQEGLEDQGKLLSSLKQQVQAQTQILEQLNKSSKPSLKDPETIKTLTKEVLNQMHRELRIERQRRGLI